MDNDRLLTVKDVAAYLNVNPKTIYRLVESGELNCYLVGRAKRFTREDIIGFLTKHKTDQGSRNRGLPQSDQQSDSVIKEK